MNINELVKQSIKSLIDDLNRFLIFIFIVLFILSFFIKFFYLDLIKYLILIIIIFRLFSKNKNKRYKENKKFIQIKTFVLKPYNTLKRNFKDRKEYVYKKCNKCKTILKLPLPKNRGTNNAKCPTCKNKVKLFTLRKRKIKVIKSK